MLGNCSAISLLPVGEKAAKPLSYAKGDFMYKPAHPFV